MMSKEIEEISIGKDVEPITETQPPLVIDLPEGQKMVVGKLDPDTVIEVATWRGTGRPDSRTNRLMLGVTSNSTRSIENQAEQSPVNQSIKNSSNESSHQINTGIQYSYAASTTTDEQIKQIQGDKKEKKSLVKLLLTVLIAIGVIALAIGPVGIRFAHPRDGIGTFAGSASSSIAVVIPIKEPKVGMNVITEIKNRQEGPILGAISVASNDDLLISTEKNSFQVKSDDLHGRVVAVLPFMGLITNLFNNG
jgi:hypothetical protein